MVKPITKARKSEPLHVFSAVWQTNKRVKWRGKDGKLRRSESYDEAREYARQHGYNGIHINYSGPTKKEN